jgi:hypothetical protein
MKIIWATPFQNSLAEEGYEVSTNDSETDKAETTFKKQSLTADLKRPKQSKNGQFGSMKFAQKLCLF